MRHIHDRYYAFRPDPLKNYAVGAGGFVSMAFAPMAMRTVERLMNIVVNPDLRDYLKGFPEEYLIELSYVRIHMHEKVHGIYRERLTPRQQKAYASISWDLTGWNQRDTAQMLSVARRNPENHFMIRYPFEGANTSQEDFVDHFTVYRMFGPQFRAAAEKSPVLRQKYEFFRDEIFHGIEYGRPYDYRESAPSMEESLVQIPNKALAAPSDRSLDPHGDPRTIESVSPVFYRVSDQVGILMTDLFINNIVHGPENKHLWSGAHYTPMRDNEPLKQALRAWLAASNLSINTIHVSDPRQNHAIRPEKIREILYVTHAAPGYITLGTSKVLAGLDVAMDTLSHEKRHKVYELLTEDQKEQLASLQQWIRVESNSPEVFDANYKDDNLWQEYIVLSTRSRENEFLVIAQKLVQEGKISEDVVHLLEKIHDEGELTPEEIAALTQARDLILADPLTDHGPLVRPEDVHELGGGYLPAMIGMGSHMPFFYTIGLTLTVFLLQWFSKSENRKVFFQHTESLHRLIAAA